MKRPEFVRPNPAHRALALVALALCLPGCSTWKPLRQPIEQVAAEPASEECVRLEFRDGSTLEMFLGSADADSLRGWRTETVRPTHRSEKRMARRGAAVAIARTDIVSIEERRVDGGLTAAGILAAAAFIVALGLGSMNMGP